MARARWYFKSGDSERGPYSAHQLARMVQTGVIHPETPVRKGNQDADRSSTGESDGWKEAQRIAFLSQLFERGKAQRRDEPWGGEATTRKLVPLAAKAGAAAAGLLNPDEVMQFYISPFEALQMDGAAAFEELDVKVIQRGKQRLLQELDLNDGKVSWLEDYSLDRSRALNLDEELLDEDRRRYHWAIFQSKHLLRFLTHGAVDHFLYSEDDSPHGALTLFEREPAFRSFLSGPFSRQYNLVLTRSIKRRLLPAIEALFVGRRWVEPNDNEACFEGADREVGELVELMRGKAVEGCGRKVSLGEVEGFLRQHSFVELFNLLPAHFAPFQKELVEHVRSLAISCFNTHDDSGLSKSILSLCNRFKFRSIELSTRLKGDFENIEEIIREEEKHSFSALIQAGQTVRVTRGEIQVGGENISASEVRTIRWGVFIRTVNGMEREHSFSLVVGSSTKVLRISWDMRGLFGDIRSWFRADESALPVSQQSTSAQEACFERMIAAVFRHLVPGLVMRLIERIEAGQTVAVGPCKLSGAGVEFSTGLLFQTNHLRPWHDVDTQLHRGEVHVFSRADRSVRVSMSAKDTDNAVLLPILCAMMRERTPARQAAGEAGKERKPAERAPAALASEKSGLLWVVGIVTILIMTAVVFSLGSPTPRSTPASTPTSTPASGTPSTAARPPAYSAPLKPAARGSQSEGTYRVPTYMKAELDREGEAIDREKATAAAWGAQLERLGRELERDQAYLNHTSQYAVDQFNRKVDAYNMLLEQVRAQERLVNRMVELYNAKLEQYGR